MVRLLQSQFTSAQLYFKQFNLVVLVMRSFELLLISLYSSFS